MKPFTNPKTHTDSRHHLRFQPPTQWQGLCWLGGWWNQFKTLSSALKNSASNWSAFSMKLPCRTPPGPQRPGHAVPGNRQEPIWVPIGLSIYDYSDYRLKTNDVPWEKKMRGRILWITVLIICLVVQWGVTPLPIDQTVEKGNNYVRVSECWLQYLSPRINQLYLCLGSNQWP